MRVHVKQRQYQIHVKERSTGGWVNTANGDWTKAEMGIASHANGVEGSRSNKPESERRPHKGGKVHWSKRG